MQISFLNKMCCGGRLKSAVPAEKISQILPLLSTSENQGGHFVDILAWWTRFKNEKVPYYRALFNFKLFNSTIIHCITKTNNLKLF